MAKDDVPFKKLDLIFVVMGDKEVENDRGGVITFYEHSGSGGLFLIKWPVLSPSERSRKPSRIGATGLGLQDLFFNPNSSYGKLLGYHMTWMGRHRLQGDV